MAKILVLTANMTDGSFTNTRDVLVDLGHEVVGTLDTPAAMDAAWTDHLPDMVATVRATQSRVAPWLAARWGAGTPILVGGAEAGAAINGRAHTGVDLGILGDALLRVWDPSAREMRVEAPHPIVEPYPVGTWVRVVRTSGDFNVMDLAPVAGTEVGHGRNTYLTDTEGAYLSAFEKGSVILPPTDRAPARAVFCGWLFGREADSSAPKGYSPDGVAILGRVIDWLVAPAFTPPDPVIPPPETYVPEVRVDGIVADVDTVRIVSDSPAHLGIPPGVPRIAGAEATLDWEWPETAQVDAEHPWAGEFRPAPGATATVDVPGPDGRLFRAFTGVIDETDVSLSDVPLRSVCVDPLAGVDVKFSAPALLRYVPLAGAHTADERPRTNLMSVYFAERAMEAVGARTTVPRTPSTVAHLSMCGSLHPANGTLVAGGRWDSGAPVVPSPSPSFASMGDGSGRVGCTNPWAMVDVDAWGGATDAAWTLSLELDPSTVTTPADCDVRFYDASEGVQVRVVGADVRLSTVGGPLLATLDRTGATRLLVRYDPATSVLSAVLDTDPDTVHEVAGVTLPGLTTAYGRLRIAGQGDTDPTPIADWPVACGAVSVYRDGPPLGEDENLLWPRSFAVHLTPTWSERWWLQAHPAIVDEGAVRWVTQAAHREQALLWTDHVGVTHWADTVGFDEQPVVGTLTDAAIADPADAVALDEVAHVTRRRDQVSRVRVTGRRGATRWSGRERPTLVAARAGETVKLEPGDDPVELWLEAPAGTFWAGPLDLDWRQAGGPWGKDFERGRGSYWGGHVVNSDGDPVRWADSGDVTVTIDEVGYDAVKVTLAPGPTLPAGATFVNLPYPDSPGLASYPEVRDAALPVIRAWSVAEVVDTEGASTDLGPSVRPEYVHAADWSAGWLDGGRSPEELAQMLADRYTDHVGEVVIDCAAAPVRIGERWRVEVTGPADLVLDVVVIGIPRLTASAGEASMRLRTWCLSAEPAHPTP